MLRNDRKCKYISMLPEIYPTWQGLKNESNIILPLLVCVPSIRTSPFDRGRLRQQQYITMPIMLATNRIPNIVPATRPPLEKKWKDITENLISTFSFYKMHLKMLFVKWQPLCASLNAVPVTQIYANYKTAIILQTPFVMHYLERPFLYWGNDNNCKCFHDRHNLLLPERTTMLSLRGPTTIRMAVRVTGARTDEKLPMRAIAHNIVNCVTANWGFWKKEKETLT